MNWRVSLWPDQAQYRPDAQVGLIVDVSGLVGTTVELRLVVMERTVIVAEQVVSAKLSGATTQVVLQWQPPTGQEWRAYGADLTLMVDGQVVSRASTAFDVAPHWGSAPRYGFLSNFSPEQSGAQDTTRLNNMLKMHLNCVQFYDWMYTHYDYIPPTDIFTDPLGRTMDFSVVRRRVALCRERGMAPIAYGSIYGAEKEFSEAHPDWLLYDGAGKPIVFAGMFYIQDPSADCGWQGYLLETYRKTLEMGFAGIHCDTYGSPKAGLTHDGRVVRLDDAIPSLMAGAQALAELSGPDGGCMLNSVRAWPVETAAKAAGSVLYVEVWDPDDTYCDLHEILLRMRRADQTRQPILSAYLPPFDNREERPAGAMAGLRLAVATVFACGGFHLLMGEGYGVLSNAYYPHWGALNSTDSDTVQAYWDFQTRYGPVLADPKANDLTTANSGGGAQEAKFSTSDGVAFSAKGLPGTVWHILKEGRGYRTVNLVNLTAVQNPKWFNAQPDAPVVHDISVRLETLLSPKAVWWASPDFDGGRPQPLTWTLEPDAAAGQVLATTIPQLLYWSLLVVED